MMLDAIQRVVRMRGNTLNEWDPANALGILFT